MKTINAIHILLIASACIITTGCVSSAIDRASSKYRNLLVSDSTRATFREKLGVPVDSWETGSTKLARYNATNSYAYDVFAVTGKIAKPGDGAGAATVNAISLGSAEAIMIPLTVASVVNESSRQHTLVIFYDTSLHYRHHDLYDKNGRQEDTSGF